MRACVRTCVGFVLQAPSSRRLSWPCFICSHLRNSTAQAVWPAVPQPRYTWLSFALRTSHSSFKSLPSTLRHRVFLVSSCTTRFRTSSPFSLQVGLLVPHYGQTPISKYCMEVWLGSRFPTHVMAICICLIQLLSLICCPPPPPPPPFV